MGLSTNRIDIPETPEEAIRIVSEKINSLMDNRGGRKAYTLTSIAKATKTDISTILALSQKNLSFFRDKARIADIGVSLGAFNQDNSSVLETVQKSIKEDAEFRPNPLSERITERMNHYRMSGAELAKLTGCTPANIYNLRHNGARPSADIIARVAKVLCTTPEWLLTGVGSVDEADAADLARQLLALTGRDREILRAALKAMVRYDARSKE